MEAGLFMTMVPENELLIKTPYLPAIYENNKKKEYEWYNSYTKVKVVDNYYYSLWVKYFELYFLSNDPNNNERKKFATMYVMK